MLVKTFLGNQLLYIITMLVLFPLALLASPVVKHGNGNYVDSLESKADTLKGMTGKKHKLKEVVVRGRTKIRELKDSPLTVEAINVKELHGRSGDVVALLNRAPGVRLRTDGYLGSPVNINLNGLQGKAVRLFKDGIPMDIFGHGFDPGMIPSNLLERIEIYKGVLPISLGADALGGGINFVSRYPSSSLLDASYELGSFNTHRASLTGFFTNGAGLYSGINASFSYSDNDYKVTVPLYDPATAQSTPTRLKRFHDAARAVYVEAYAGWKGLKWADDLRFTLIGSSFYKQLQHGVYMTKPFGEAEGSDRGITPMLRYDKALIDGKLKLNAVLAYSLFDTRFVDTSRNSYGWDGSILSRNKPTMGEINTGNDQRQRFQFYTGRFNAAYGLGQNHTLEFNEIYIAKKRTGSDPLGAKDILEHIDVLTVPAHYRKNVMGLGLNSKLLDGNLEHITGLKWYSLSTKGYTTDNYRFAWRDETNANRFGFMDALSYRLSKRWLAKISYEYATRLPDEYEVFGDSRQIKENLGLKPESSHNVNLQFQYGNDRQHAGGISVATNFFYRSVSDMIFLHADIPFSRYINYSDTRVNGVEFDVNYYPFNFFSLGANGTYQDIRRVGITEESIKYLEGSRVTNIPFLFGNLNARFQFKDVVQPKSKLEVYGYLNYVHRFYLNPIPKNQEPPLFGQPDAFVSTLVVPNDGRTGQSLYTAGLVYYLPNNRASIGIECMNLTDARIFDNFSIERPGRSFHLKLRWQLTGNKHI